MRLLKKSSQGFGQLLLTASFGLAAPGLICTLAHGQQGTEQPSLGALARKLRAERAADNRKPVAVFTNDNLPSSPTLQGSGNKTSEMSKSPKPLTTVTPLRSGEHGEKYFRSKLATLRSSLDLHRRELAVLEQRLSLASTQYYPNPQTTLEQESTPAFYSAVTKLRAQIRETKRKIAEDQEATNALRDELQKAGGDPGWLR